MTELTPEHFAAKAITMGRDEAGKAIRKRAMEGCPLARELLILRGMCSCQGDEKSVDDAEDRYLELAALTHPPQDAWNEGFDFAMKACGWQEGEDPSTEGLYVARDSKGNVEVGMWYAKTVTQPAGWTREFRDVDRDDIVAWMAIPDWKPKDEA